MASGTARRSAIFAFKMSDEIYEIDYEDSDVFIQDFDDRLQLEFEKNYKRHGYLLKTPSLSVTILVVFGSLILIIFAVLGLQSPARHTTLFDFFHKTGEYSPEIDSEHFLGIELHPEDHVYRQPTTIVQNWTISSDYRFPDGVKKKVYLVNGQFPGPTIECRQGDKLIIHVTNSLSVSDTDSPAQMSEGISIHWHGLNMRGSNHMDGVVGFTQCAIPAGGSFTYEFEVGEQTGTFWWHAHSSVHRGDGMFGGLVIHKTVHQSDKGEMMTDVKEYGYEKEVLLMIGDWYHQSAEEVLAWYTSARGFGNEPVPDSLLVNGVGKFICSMAVPAKPVECIDIPNDQIRSVLGGHLTGVPTRLRIVNVGTLAGFTLAINEGTLIPHTVDSGPKILGTPTRSVGILYPGERMDLFLEWNENPSSLVELEVILDPENFRYTNFALRPNQTFPLINPITPSKPSESLISPSPLSQSKQNHHFDLSQAKSFLFISPPLPQQADEQLLLYTKTQKLSINSNHPQGFMNRTSWAPQSSPLLSIPRERWDVNQLVPWISLSPETAYQKQGLGRFGKWIDIIINNLDDGSHPFHLHGYNFYVLYSYRSEHGWGSYTPYTASSGGVPTQLDLNLETPLLKDTVSVPRRGFVVLRFWADNPGIWMFHCHVIFHQASGMAMGIAVGGSEVHKDVDMRSAELCKA
ncbi:hypothetical protein B7463_g7435, partial [Scytalidium lignicola]